MIFSQQYNYIHLSSINLALRRVILDDTAFYRPMKIRFNAVVMMIFHPIQLLPAAPDIAYTRSTDQEYSLCRDDYGSVSERLVWVSSTWGHHDNPQRLPCPTPGLSSVASFVRLCFLCLRWRLFWAPYGVLACAYHKVSWAVPMFQTNMAIIHPGHHATKWTPQPEQKVGFDCRRFSLMRLPSFGRPVWAELLFQPGWKAIFISSLHQRGWFSHSIWRRKSGRQHARGWSRLPAVCCPHAWPCSDCHYGWLIKD